MGKKNKRDTAQVSTMASSEKNAPRLEFKERMNPPCIEQ